ncbi:hypothetical protein FRB94_005025 [Tulasnella sp. JGI-2019a]|nr:hypothetical protein FRB94_005025 [Tulasnella sp. JGI-2019a]
MCMDAWGWTGPAVKLCENYRKMENQIWEIVAASGDFGDSEVGERQYHILAVNSGLMLQRLKGPVYCGVAIRKTSFHSLEDCFCWERCFLHHKRR